MPTWITRAVVRRRGPSTHWGCRSRSIRHGVVLLLALLLVTGIARAQGAEAARQLAQEAIALEGQERWKDAAAKLTEAIVLKETPALRYHLAYCLEQTGDLVGALENYEKAADLVARGAKAKDVDQLLGPK